MLRKLSRGASQREMDRPKPNPELNNLFKAIDEGRETDAVSIILTSDVTITHSNPDKKYLETALHRATRNSMYKIMLELIKKKANVNSTEGRIRRFVNNYDPNTFSATPLHISAYNNNFRALEILLANGADVAVIDHQGKTPLHVAIETNTLKPASPKGADKLIASHYLVIQTLVLAGASPNAQTKDETTPLHLALNAKQPSSNIIYLLLINGGNPNVQDNQQITPRILAKNSSELNKVIHAVNPKAYNLPPEVLEKLQEPHSAQNSFCFKNIVSVFDLESIHKVLKNNTSITNLSLIATNSRALNMSALFRLLAEKKYFIQLTLTNFTFSTASLIQLANHVMQNNNLTSLSLIHCDLSKSRITHFLSIISSHPTLESLILVNNGFVTSNLDTIGEYVGNDCKLKWLVLREQHPSSLFSAFGNALARNTQLINVDITNINHFRSGSVETKMFAETICAIFKLNQCIESLNIAGTGINAKLLDLMIEALKSNQTLVSLNLSGNPIGDNGAASLADLIKEGSSKLRHIILHNAHITEQGASLLNTAAEAAELPITIELEKNQRLMESKQALESSDTAKASTMLPAETKAEPTSSKHEEKPPKAKKAAQSKTNKAAAKQVEREWNKRSKKNKKTKKSHSHKSSKSSKTYKH